MSIATTLLQTKVSSSSVTAASQGRTRVLLRSPQTGCVMRGWVTVSLSCAQISVKSWFSSRLETSKTFKSLTQKSNQLQLTQCYHSKWEVIRTLHLAQSNSRSLVLLLLETQVNCVYFSSQKVRNHTNGQMETICRWITRTPTKKIGLCWMISCTTKSPTWRSVLNRTWFYSPQTLIRY